MRRDDPVPLGAALQAVTNDLASGVQPGVNSGIGDLANRWEEIVGVRLSRCCLPGSLSNGTFTVHATDPGAASLVRQSAGHIGAQMRAVLKVEVTQIRVVVSRSRNP